MKEYDFEVRGRARARSYADEIIEFAAEVDNATKALPNDKVSRVNVRYGYIIFERFDYNYNKVFKIGLKYGLAVSAVYAPEMHDGEIGLYFKPIGEKMVEREVVIEEEQYAFDC